MMIPKIIHYCWFGGNPFSELEEKCVASWGKYCPDYEIREWNENNFDVNACAYVKEAYKAKMWAFVSDYARLWVLYNFGGIYLDTDCELIKPIDQFLKLEALSGFESQTKIPTAIIGSRKNHPFLHELLERYRNRYFVKSNGSFDLTTNVEDITQACLTHGFIPNNEKQTIFGFTLFPRDWFCPMDWSSHKMVALTDNTHAIHHFSGSWKSQLEITKKKPNIAVKTLARIRYFLKWIRHKLLKQF